MPNMHYCSPYTYLMESFDLFLFCREKKKKTLRFTEVKGFNHWQGRIGTQIQISALPSADAVTDARGSVSPGSARDADVVSIGRVASAGGMLSPRGQGQGAPGTGSHRRVSAKGSWTRRPQLCV